jgi:hypothetical protein
MSLNINFYDFRVKFHESWHLFIPNLTRVILNFTKLLIGTFSFMKFISIKILFTFLCLFIYSYLLTFVNINNITQGFTRHVCFFFFLLNIHYYFFLFFVWNKIIFKSILGPFFLFFFNFGIKFSLCHCF